MSDTPRWHRRASAVCTVCFAALTLVCASRGHTAEEPLEALIGRLVDGFYELRGADRTAELGLVAKGATREEADRFVRGLTDGFVRCLMNELKSYSALQQESFSKRLGILQDTLDRQGTASVLEDLLTLARAQSGSSDACAADELKRAGVSVDGLN